MILNVFVARIHRGCLLHISIEFIILLQDYSLCYAPDWFKKLLLTFKKTR
jgi:hypothetical protein